METIIINPKYKSKLILGYNNGITCSFVKPIPNWWIRMWYKILLGWSWEKVEG